MTQPEGSRQDARDQADDHDSFARSGSVTAHKTGKKYQVPSMLLLDDDQQIAYEALQHRVNKCDRYPPAEMPERVVTVKEANGDETTTVIRATTPPLGSIITPYEIEGEPAFPEPYNIMLAKILLGDSYEDFKAGGGRANDVYQELLRMKDETEKRVQDDSKSADSSADGEGVPATD